MDISVVLCTYNNAERLRVTLNSFCRLNRPEGSEWELVAVNNNSTDGTEEVIKSFVDRLPITYVYEPEQGLSRARNAGLKVAQGNLIVFTDDDVEPDPDWLVAYWEAYKERPEGYYFGGPTESEYEGEPPDEDLMRVAPPSVTGIGYGASARELPENGFFIGHNWACPSEYLSQVGTFDESIGLDASKKETSVGEEVDIMSRIEEIGGKGWYVPEASVKHFVPKEKCTLDHAVSRHIAGVDVNFSKKIKNMFSPFEIPIGLYKEVIRSAVKCASKKATGKKWKKEYVMERVGEENKGV
jgi:hypothetical protein